MLNVNKNIFNANLKLTQVYCEQQLKNEVPKNNASILRSYNPAYNGQNLFNYKQNEFNHNNLSGDSNYYSVYWSIEPIGYKISFPFQTLFEEQLENKKRLVPKNNIFSDGKILLAEIDNTVTDGASESASDGLIDTYDLPPIDTWFYLTESDFYNSKMRYLFAWIPLQFCKLIDDAIAVNCVDCIYWYDDLANDKKEVMPENIEPVYEESKRTKLWDRLKNRFIN